MNSREQADSQPIGTGNLDIRQLRFVTENYPNLQGLRLVPFALLFLAKPLTSVLDSTLAFVIALALAFSLFFAIGEYYKRTFGRVQRRSRSRARDLVLILLFGAGFFAALWIDEKFQPPFSTIGLLVALLFAGIHLRSRVKRRHYAVLALLFLMLSFLPMIGLLTTGDLFGKGAPIGELVLGLTYLLVGILDHLLLVRSLSPLPVEQDENAI